MKILTPEEIKQPKQAVIIEEKKATDWIKHDPILGGQIQEETLQADGQWEQWITEYELQRNALFDAYDCVTQSFWNGIQCLANRKYGEKLDESKRWTAVKSGTLPRRGNSINAPAECIRKQGGVPETVYPSMSPTMTEAEFYQTIPASVDKQENFSKFWEFNHEWLPQADAQSANATIDMLKHTLTHCPVPACVEGSYRFNNEGEVTVGNTFNMNYTHEILVVGYVDGKYWKVLDSENPNGLVKFDWNYPLGYPKAIYLKKKFNMKLYKKNGEPTIYFKHWSQPLLIAFKDGVVPGGDVFKSLYGITNYSELPRENVDVLPFPVAPFSLTTI